MRKLFFFINMKVFIVLILISIDLDLWGFERTLHAAIFSRLNRLQKVQERQKASQLHPLHNHVAVHPKRVCSKVEIHAQQDLVEAERTLHQPEETQLHVERVPQRSQKLLQTDVQAEVPQVGQEVGRQLLNDCRDDPQRDRNFSQRIRQHRLRIPVLLQSALQPTQRSWRQWWDAESEELKLQSIWRVLGRKQRHVFRRLPWIKTRVLLHHKLRTNLFIKDGWTVQRTSPENYENTINQILFVIDRNQPCLIFNQIQLCKIVLE